MYHSQRDFMWPHASQLRPGKLAVLAFLASVSYAAPVLQAAPLILRFDATIAEVHGDIDALNLPFSLAVGQQISGKYVFESEEDLVDVFVGPHLGKQAMVSLLIDGSTHATLANLGFFSIAGAIDINTPLGGIYSSLYLGYESPTDVDPGWGGHFNGYPFGVDLFLIGPDQTIPSPNEMLDVRTWNRFTRHRRLGLHIGYYEAGEFKTVNVQAMVGDFIAVPEPIAAFLVLSLFAVTLIRNRCMRLSSNPPCKH